MPLPNNSHPVTPGSGQVLAAHTVGGKTFPVVVQCDNNGTLISDPNGVYSAVGIWPATTGAQPTHLMSILNADATLKLDILAVWFRSVNETDGGPVRTRLKRITAHSSGTTVTPEKIDTASGALDADITVRRHNISTTLVCTVTGNELSAFMDRPIVASNGLYMNLGNPFLWNHLRDGGPIVCNQNQGVVITSPPDAGMLSAGLCFGVIIFRVR